MQIRVANPGLAMLQGSQAAQSINAANRERKLTNFFAEHGGSLVNGDQNAFNAFAQLDPMGAFGLKNQMLQHRINERRLATMGRGSGPKQSDVWAANYQAGPGNVFAPPETTKSKGKTKSAPETDLQSAENHLRWVLGEQAAGRLGPPQAAAAKAQYDLALRAHEAAQPEERATVRGADGFLRYMDGNKERVFPDVVAQQDPADEYGRYVQEEIAAGREPLSRIDFKKAARGEGIVMQTADGTILSVGGAGLPELTSATQGESERTAAALETLMVELGEYERIFRDGGGALLPSVQRDSLFTARRNMQLQMKELFNLGVLNGPDLDLMDQLLIDATDPLALVLDAVGVADIEKRVHNNLTQLRNQLKRLAKPKLERMGLDVEEVAGRSTAKPIPTAVEINELPYENIIAFPPESLADLEDDAFAALMARMEAGQ